MTSQILGKNTRCMRIVLVCLIYDPSIKHIFPSIFSALYLLQEFHNKFSELSNCHDGKMFNLPKDGGIRKDKSKAEQTSDPQALQKAKKVLRYVPIVQF